MTVIFTQGHRVTGRLEIVESFFFKVAWRNPNFCAGGVYRVDDFTEHLQIWRI